MKIQSFIAKGLFRRYERENKMKKLIYILSFIFIVCSCSKNELKPLIVQTQTGDITYYVEHADTKAKMIKGLMFRKTLQSNGGMLFVFDKTHTQPVAMWMKNTYI